MTTGSDTSGDTAEKIFTGKGGIFADRGKSAGGMVGRTLMRAASGGLPGR